MTTPQDVYSALRRRWRVVPAAAERVSTEEILELPDQELVDWWQDVLLRATAGPAFGVRGWYHMLYRDLLSSKRVLDVGSGLGIDGITFARHGAHVTFLDIVESNVALSRRLCQLLGLVNVDFCCVQDLGSLAPLSGEFDVIWCQGSLINAPFEIIHAEIQQLLTHLPIGGRWIELAYPKARWERDGRPPFDRWGERTDGVGTPWVEWYDQAKLHAALHPAKFDTVLYFEFHNSDFNWFDLVRRA